MTTPIAIPIETTAEYPTRYKAFDFPGVLWEAESREGRRGGFEAAVFHLPVANEASPNLEDGVYGSVVSYQGAYWIAEITATQPTQTRISKTWRHQTEDYIEARAWLLAHLPTATDWCKRGTL